jgi:hypothetical protein
MKFFDVRPAVFKPLRIELMATEEDIFERDHRRFQQIAQFGAGFGFAEILPIGFALRQPNDFVAIELQ